MEGRKGEHKRDECQIVWENSECSTYLQITFIMLQGVFDDGNVLYYNPS